MYGRVFAALRRNNTQPVFRLKEKEAMIHMCDVWLILVRSIHNSWASPQNILPKIPNSTVGRIQYVYGRDDKDDEDENSY